MADQKQTSELDAVAMLRTFKRWWKLDSQHSAAWRKQAREDYTFVSDDQWDAQERSYMMSAEGGNRVPIQFNRVLTIIESVSGIEINGRHETTFLPRGTAPGTVQKNELLSSASQWMDDESDAPTAQSRAFQDCLKVGMGWTESALSYEDEPDGSYTEKRIDPLEMWWDYKAREPNLADARRIWHVRSDVDIEDARAMFPDASDEDLDAAWATPGGESGKTHSREEKRDRSDENSEGLDADTVTLVRVQWVEKEPYYRVLLPGQQKLTDLSREDYKALTQRARDAGVPAPRAVQSMRKVYKQAFIGGRVLSEDFEAPCPHFTFNCVTGKLSEMKGTWFGLTHLARDPQKWANKWLTQSLHILNTNARGGLMIEEDAPADMREFEENWSRPDSIVKLSKDALSKGKVQPKPQTGFTADHLRLMEFAIGSIRDATGINLELLGLRDANQPGVLEAQRKQAGMTILATLFDSLRGFRKRVGRVRLYYLQTYLADGRLIRLAGPEGEQYVPLVQDKVAGRYDVIVGDAPTSPNQREQTWQQLQPLLAMFKDVMPQQVALELLEFSPLPSAIVEKIRAAVQKAQEEAQQAEQTPEAQAQKQLAMRGAQAEVVGKEAKARLDMAKARAEDVNASVKVADAERDRMQPQRERVPERA